MEATKRDNSGMLTGLFYDRNSAESAYSGLAQRGYTKDDVNVLMSDETRKKHFSDDSTHTELGTKAAEGAGIGGAVGGTLGAVLAGVAATGTSLALPGLGLVIAGPIAAALAGAGAGAATGGLLGALIGYGIPEEQVKHYESGLKQGGILMGVKPRNDEDAHFLEQHWRSNNGMHIYRPGGASASAGNETDTVVGVYDDYDEAESAVQALVSEGGLARSRVQLNPARDDAGTRSDAVSGDSHASGGGIRGFFYSLFGGDPDNENRHIYQESVRRGCYVVTADVDNESEADRVSAIMGRFHPVDIDERVNHWKQQGWSRHDESAPRYSEQEIQQERERYNAARTTQASDSTRIPVVEEELKVGKREVQRGGVRVVRRLREIPVHESVQLREEHVRVARHPVDKAATSADLAAFKEGSVELSETAEEAVVSKTARVVEEVVVGKEVSQRTEQINDTVRRTDVQVEQLSADAAGGGFDDTDFRRHWQSTYGSSGGRYEDYDAAYRYGTSAATSGRYQSGRWSEVEPQLRSDWESSHPGNAWDKVKDAVRYGTERVSGNRRH
ncbi:YsnF/AvaK domain-containing protein [Noviherbaspirillum aridicola]|uniref:DUF2382 domain-containing protein n=1 Tax=Noviherbaspirillum aridicola TaxID=2849687 RepID=A0ABQ4Q9M2_9BURK|nr:YsnF/AvaK domain-containing protein [Noviherbaspirillum aridicola]GIZ53924.1 hypothetical protein NCCP691_39380 [Noviherbaspirillum aridicola]